MGEHAVEKAESIEYDTRELTRYMTRLLSILDHRTKLVRDRIRYVIGQPQQPQRHNQIRSHNHNHPMAPRREDLYGSGGANMGLLGASI